MIFFINLDLYYIKCGIHCHNVSPSFFIFLDCFGWKWCGLSETMESVLNPHRLVTFTLLWIRSGQIEMSDFRNTLKMNSLFSNIFLFQCLSLKVISSGWKIPRKRKLQKKCVWTVFLY